MRLKGSLLTGRVDQAAPARLHVGARHGRVVEVQCVGEFAQRGEAVARGQVLLAQVFRDQVGDQQIGRSVAGFYAATPSQRRLPSSAVV